MPNGGDAHIYSLNLQALYQALDREDAISSDGTSAFKWSTAVRAVEATAASGGVPAQQRALDMLVATFSTLHSHALAGKSNRSGYLYILDPAHIATG